MTQHEMIDNLAYDFVLSVIMAAFYIGLIYAVILVSRYRAKRPAKGNPFRQFKDYQLHNILNP